jgi:hypothetical protein
VSEHSLESATKDINRSAAALAMDEIAIETAPEELSRDVQRIGFSFRSSLSE